MGGLSREQDDLSRAPQDEPVKLVTGGGGGGGSAAGASWGELDTTCSCDELHIIEFPIVLLKDSFPLY
jgi:hypothetical protein